jgi:hypothetical protein
MRVVQFEVHGLAQLPPVDAAFAALGITPAVLEQ